MKKELIKLFGILIVLISMAGSAYAQYNVSTLKFDGSNDYVRYADDSTLGLLDGASNYTIEAWVKIDQSAAAYGRIIQRFELFRVYLGSNNRLSFGVKHGASTWAFYHSTNNALPHDNLWHHIAIIRNTADTPTSLKLFVDGVDVTALDKSAYPLKDENNRNLYIGDDGASGHYFKGKIDEVRLKNVAESIGNLHTDKNDTLYLTDANTAVLFHFDENGGSVTKNSANGVDARLGDSGAGDSKEPSWATFDDLWFPIELKSFTAKEDNGSIRLNWTTASETNNKGFEIQRSKDGKEWEVIGFVDGQGDSRGEINYEFTDKSPKKINYYRLNQIDFDGNNKYSNVVSVELKKDNNISVFPNPTNDFLNVTALNSNTDYYIYDKLGKVVSTGRTSGKIDVSSLASGVYYIKTGKEDKVIKFVVE